MMTRSNIRVNHILTFISLLGIKCIVRSFTLKLPSLHCRSCLKESKSSFQLYGSHSDRFPLSYSNSDEHSDSDPRGSEFSSLEAREDNNVRKSRRAREKIDQRRFAGYGNELWELRSMIDDLNQRIAESMSSGADVEALQYQLEQAESRDPYHVYGSEIKAMEKSSQEGRIEEASMHHQEAMSARSCLPQFNLEGLWIGKYGDHGFEMINITYVGDIMIAKKVSGDKNVPTGEITFQLDMSPPLSDSSLRSLRSTRKPLENIVLSIEAAKRWGTSQITRYLGLGQVAEEGFVNNQWVDGQLIVISEEYFSFSWMPLNYQIFFGRPSPELSLKMLRESRSHRQPTVEDNLDTLKEHVKRCFEVTAADIDDEIVDGKDNAFSCIYHTDDTCSFE